MKNVKVRIEGPGCEGSLTKTMTDTEFQYWQGFTKTWNDLMTSHCEPFIILEEISGAVDGNINAAGCQRQVESGERFL